MVLSEILQAHLKMRFVIGIVVVAATLGVVKLWASGVMSNGVLPTVVAGAVLGIILFACVVGMYLRNRERRRSMDMRDSALW
jgi:hypothetical protein